MLLHHIKYEEARSVIAHMKARIEGIKYRNNTLGRVIDQLLIWLFFHASLFLGKSTENVISSMDCYTEIPQNTWL